jgi:hypothetical protein
MTQQALQEGGVWSRVYHHDAPPGTPWPTLGELIESDQRLVVFTDAGDHNQDWYLDWTNYGWETPYDDDTFTCADNRGDPTAYDNQIFILNHYTLCALGGCEENAEVNNAFDFLYPRAVECGQFHESWNPWEQAPTFINVDHYQVPDTARSSAPDAIDVAAELNAGG